MLDIGWSELLVVAVVAIVVVGPKDLPKLMRNFGFYAGKIRRAASDFQRQFNEALVESEADEVRKNIEAIRGTMGGTVEMGGASGIGPLDKPLMTGQTAPAQQALGEPILGKPMEAQQPKPEKPKKSPRAKSSGNKTSRNKTTRAKTSRNKTARVSKRAPAKSTSTKPRKAKVVAKARVKAPIKARRKP